MGQKHTSAVEMAPIDIAKMSGRMETVLAEIHGPLALHQDFLTERWTVTHIQTGCSIGPDLQSKRRAVTLVGKLRKAPLGDAYWQAIKRPEDVRKRSLSSQRAAVRKLIGPEDR